MSRTRLRIRRRYRFDPPVAVFERTCVDGKLTGDAKCRAFDTGTYKGFHERTGKHIFEGVPFVVPVSEDGSAKREFGLRIDDENGRSVITPIRRQGTNTK